MNKETELELLNKIYKRLGWIMFWIIFLGIAIFVNLQDVVLNTS